MRRYRLSIIMVLALLYALIMSMCQTASAESGDGHRNAPKTSIEVSVRVLPAPGRQEDHTGSGWDEEYYGSGWDEEYYGSGHLPFTGPGQSVIFALEGGVTAILLGSLLVFASTRGKRSRRGSEIIGR